MDPASVTLLRDRSSRLPYDSGKGKAHPTKIGKAIGRDGLLGRPTSSHLSTTDPPRLIPCDKAAGQERAVCLPTEDGRQGYPC
jgi:hypothetical protein